MTGYVLSARIAYNTNLEAVYGQIQTSLVINLEDNYKLRSAIRFAR